MIPLQYPCQIGNIHYSTCLSHNDHRAAARKQDGRFSACGPGGAAAQMSDVQKRLNFVNHLHALISKNIALAQMRPGCWKPCVLTTAKEIKSWNNTPFLRCPPMRAWDCHPFVKRVWWLLCRARRMGVPGCARQLRLPRDTLNGADPGCQVVTRGAARSARAGGRLGGVDGRGGRSGRLAL